MKKNRITYGIIVFLALLFIYFYGGLVPWTLFYFVLLLPILSLIHLLVIYYTFRWNEILSTRHYTKGDIIEYKWKIQGSLFLPYPYIELHLYTPDMFLTGREEVVPLSYLQTYDSYISYKTRCRYRGRYQVGITRIVFHDFLFLFKMVHRSKHLNSVVVYPRIRSPEEYIESRIFSDAKMSFYNKYRGEESHLNIREYTVGDSSRLIHWKLTSKLDKTMVIDKETTLDNHVILVLNLKRQNMSSERRLIFEDIIIEKAVSLAYHFLNRSIPVDVLYNHDGPHLWFGSSPYDFEDLFRLLAEIPFKETVSVDQFLDMVLKSEHVNASVFMLSIEISQNFFMSLLKLKTIGHEVFLYYCNPDAMDTGNHFRDSLDAYGIQSMRLEPEEIL